MSEFFPFRFENDTLTLLDQRELPLKEVWRDYTDYTEVAQAITTMVVRGAPAIGCTAAWGFFLGVKALSPWPSPEAFPEAIATIHTTLSQTRPTAVNLRWALQKMGALPYTADREAYLSRAREAANTIAREDLAACKTIGQVGLGVLPRGKINVLTHCNAGALATAGYGTALGVIRALHSAGRLNQTYADDTRPRQQGARLTVWELLRDTIPVTLLPDTASGIAMAQGRIDAVVVGADRIASNGDVANKVGTYLVALAAKASSVPFYVAAPLSSFDFTLTSGDEIPIEERSGEEVRRVGGVLRTPPQVPVYNPAFDITPAKLVTGIITERGYIEQPTRATLAAFRERSV